MEWSEQCGFWKFVALLASIGCLVLSVPEMGRIETTVAHTLKIYFAVKAFS